MLSFHSFFFATFVLLHLAGYYYAQVIVDNETCKVRGRYRPQVTQAISEVLAIVRRAIERLDRKDTDDIDASHLYWVLLGNSDYGEVRGGCY